MAAVHEAGPVVDYCGERVDRPYFDVTLADTRPVSSLEQPVKRFLKRAIILLNALAYPLVLGYWRLTRPVSTSVVVFLQYQDQVLLVRNSYGTRGWTAPGGGVRRGESLAAAARREVREEVGIEVAQLMSHGSVSARVSGRRDTTWVFSAQVDDPRVANDSLEIAEARWVKIADAAALGLLLPQDLEQRRSLSEVTTAGN